MVISNQIETLPSTYHDSHQLKTSIPKNDIQKIEETLDPNNLVKTKGASIWNAAANIGKSGLGIGMIMMPYAFSKCGIYIPLIFLIIVGLLCFYCWNLLGNTLSKIKRDKSLEGNPLYSKYKDNLTLDKALAIIINPYYQYLAQLMNGINIYGSCLVYIIFITKSFYKYFEDYKFLSFIITVSVIGVIFFAFSFLQNIQSYGRLSQIALGVYVLVIITIIIKSVIVISEQSESTNSDILVHDWIQVLKFLGSFILAYDINGTVSLVHSSMKDQSKFWISLMMYIALAAILGGLLGIIGYCAFRDSTKEIIFENVGSFYGIGDSILVLYNLTLVMNMILYGFVITKMIEGIFIKNELSFHAQNRKIQIAIRVAYIVSLSILAYLISEVQKVFSIIGCISGVSLTYIFPCLLYEKVHQKEKISLIKIFNIFIIILGIIGGITGLVFTIIEI